MANVRGVLSASVRVLVGATIIGGLLSFRMVSDARGQLHTTGFTVTKSCPLNAAQGETVTCTITIENQDADHGVVNIVVTNQVPFNSPPHADGTPAPVSGCATSLSANNGVPNSGPDFTSCTVQETFNQPCSGTSQIIRDRVEVTGDDAGVEGLEASGSATGQVVVACNTPTPTNTPTSTPTLTPTNTPTSTPTNTPTRTPTPSPTNTRPPVPVVPAPTSPSGLLLIAGLAVAMLWMLRRFGRAKA